MSDITLPKNLAPGAETAQWVLDTITQHPEMHNQEYWESNICGTVRCVGGWALWAHGYSAEDETSIAAELLGLETVEEGCYCCEDIKGPGPDADRLFHWTNDAQAVEALRYIANGKEIDWEKVRGK